ncbi:hypothetical protein AVDCRST_MAG81-713 [uncultured Synechococcales cyanobacterium]|uniref:Uncharacterized protein n=1 Tax=uncultured Synechococcales cyanobacterium TaxID=1936017 RepID=A0A6J4UUX0_9CYAN|nr:hypothetical protein AVDCRST_MAG81-713 [uncultured Synechococcales cyanobacterium]
MVGTSNFGRLCLCTQWPTDITTGNAAGLVWLITSMPA